MLSGLDRAGTSIAPDRAAPADALYPIRAGVSLNMSPDLSLASAPLRS